MTDWSTHAHHRYSHSPYPLYQQRVPSAHSANAPRTSPYTVSSISTLSVSPHLIHSNSPAAYSHHTHSPFPQQQQQQQHLYHHPHHNQNAYHTFPSRQKPVAYLPLHHPSPVRAHSYPSRYEHISSFSTGSASSLSSKHNLPSPPLSASAMPDPWTAERPETDDDEWGVSSPRSTGSGNGVGIVMHTGNGHAGSPRGLALEGNPYASPPRHGARPPAKNKSNFSAPYTLEVWASVMDKSKGRDKVLKTVQYSLRTYIYILGLIAAVRPLSKWFRANDKRTKLAVAGLSLTRKCLLLLNPLRPIGALLSPEPTSAREFLEHLIDLIGALADDIFCLSKLGLVSRKKGKEADKWANRIWLFSTVTGLYALYAKSFRQRTKAEENEDMWKQRKLLADLVFVSYDIFEISWFKEPVLCISGLTAAIIGTGQLYQKEWQTLAKKRLM